jgi:hypothetical protein
MGVPEIIKEGLRSLQMSIFLKPAFSHFLQVCAFFGLSHGHPTTAFGRRLLRTSTQESTISATLPVVPQIRKDGVMFDCFQCFTRVKNSVRGCILVR